MFHPKGMINSLVNKLVLVSTLGTLRKLRLYNVGKALKNYSFQEAFGLLLINRLAFQRRAQILELINCSLLLFSPKLSPPSQITMEVVIKCVAGASFTFQYDFVTIQASE